MAFSNQPTQSLSQSGHHHLIRIPAYLLDAERYLAHITSICLHALLFFLLIKIFILEPGITDGASMRPTIPDNTALIVEKVSLLVYPPQRFDIIQHIEPTKKQSMFVKRVIGLPGETVTIKQNGVFIKGITGDEVKLIEPYLRSDIIISVPYGAQREFTLSDNEYFVLGDNRPDSNDSRGYGPVHRKLITGKVLPLVLR